MTRIISELGYFTLDLWETFVTHHNALVLETILKMPLFD